MTTDEALRVAREALTNLLRVFPTDDDMIEAGWGVSEVNEACDVYDAGQAALRTIALAVEGSADGGSSQEASTCSHGVPHRWPCDQCDAAFLPGTPNDQQEKQR